MDAVLGYPLYYGIVNGFGTPMGNMSAFTDVANQVLTAFPVWNVLLDYRFIPDQLLGSERSWEFHRESRSP